MIKKLGITILSALAFLTPSIEYASSCAWPQTMQAAVDRVDVIFYGKAIKTVDVDFNPDETRRLTRTEQYTQFKVKEIWKGNLDERKTIFHGNGNNCCYCGLVFAPGKYYLVLGSYNKDDKIVSSSCTGTEYLSLKDYQYLDFDPVTPYNELIKTLKEMPSQKY